MRQYQVVGALLGVLVVGCATQRRADKVMAEADSAVKANHLDATRFAPQAFEGVGESYGAARKAYAAKEWGAAIKAGEETMAKVRELPSAIAEGRSQATAQWPARRDSTRAMLNLLASRLAAWSQSGKYPDSLSAGTVKDMQLTVDTLDTGLDNAQQAFASGDVGGAVHALDRVRQRLAGLLRASGVAPPNPHGG